MRNIISPERYDELFFDAINNGTPLGDGDYQKGDVVVRGYCRNGNTIYGSLYIRGEHIICKHTEDEPADV